jgi:cytoskeleton protein RodZ
MREEDAIAPANAAKSVGEMLREARERRQWSAADVARHLRFSLRQVEALEANDFAALPGDTIVRGFIRNYARLLQIDAAPLLAAYEAARPQEVQPAPAVRGEGIDISPRPSRRWLLRLLVLLVIVIGVPLAIYALLHDEGALSPRPAAKPAPAAQVRPLPLPAAEPVAPLKPAASPAQAATAPAAEMPSLHFVFDEEAWVEVRDRNGRKLFSRLGRKGTEETLTGEGPFSLVVGNAAHVRLTYNGKPVDLTPYIKVNVARLTLE